MMGEAYNPSPHPGPVFVGRVRELAVLRGAVAAAVGGAGRLVLLAGEPGIGKTRLAEELARHAAAAGAVVRWGRCRESADTPAFWPWIQILRAQIRAIDTEQLQAQLGAGAAEIVRLVPELRERLPDLAAAPPADDAGARFRLFDSVVGFLCANAIARPLVLVLEDLHWAQATALNLLRFLVEGMQQMRIAVVGTYRSVDPAASDALVEFLAALPYQPLVQRLELGGLGEDEIGALIEALGYERSPALAARIHHQSGGNPFFATELARTLAGGAELQVSDTVRDAIGHRLRGLSGPCRRVLQIASVLGAEFRLRTLERVVTETGDTEPVLHVLGEATAGRVLVETEPAAGGYRFTHALIREVLYTDLPADMRAQLHGEVATALEALDEASRTDGASVLAHHFAEAIPGCAEGTVRRTCVDKAVGYATMAAEQATATCAYAEAVDQYQRALGLLSTWAAPDAGRQCDLLLALGEAQLRAGLAYAVRSATFYRAAALARELRGPQRLARAALGLAERAATLEAAPGARIGLLQEALEAVGPGDSSLRARLLGSLALATYLADLQVDSAQLGSTAVAMARRLRASHMVVLRSGYHALTEPGQVRERMALATEFLQIGEQAADSETVMYARMYRVFEAIAAGQLASAERELAVFSRLADELRQPFFQYRAIAVRAALALLAGRFADAEHLTGEALRLMQGSEEPTVFLTYVEHMSLIYREQGRLGELAGLQVGTADQLPHTPGARAGAAWIYAETGRMKEAHAEVEGVAADGLEMLPHRWGWFLNMALLAEVCALLGDRTRAQSLYAYLRPYAPHLVFDPSPPICVGSVSLYLGQLAQTLGRPDDALQHFDEALATHRLLPSPPWVADTQYPMAVVLLQRDAPGDRERAGELLTEVLETTERLGMRRLQRKALELRGRLHGGVAGRFGSFESSAASAPPCSLPSARGDEMEGCRSVGGDKDGSPALQRGDLERGPLVSARVAATLRKEVDYWVIGWNGSTWRLKDRIGLHYLAVLLRHPGREFLATDLVAAVHGGQDESTVGVGGRPALGASEPYFDEPARRQYAQRLRALRAVVEEAQALNDRERASRAQAEIDALTEELQRGLGLGGRVRPSGSPIERARVALTHAIKATLRAIAECDAELGHYLAATIKTGTYSSYSPDPRHAVAWAV